MIIARMTPVMIARMTPNMLFGLKGGPGIAGRMRSFYQLNGRKMPITPVNTNVIQRGKLPERFHYTNQVAVVTYSNEEEVDANS